MALAAVCAALGLRLAQGDDRRTWAAVSAIAATTLAGYVLSRTTGLPGARDDIGDWANPLGLAALAVEAALVAVAVTHLYVPSLSASPTNAGARFPRRLRAPARTG
jgi:hypothetical protein